jgi:hypothetical protein
MGKHGAKKTVVFFTYWLCSHDVRFFGTKENGNDRKAFDRSVYVIVVVIVLTLGPPTYRRDAQEMADIETASVIQVLILHFLLFKFI